MSVLVVGCLGRMDASHVLYMYNSFSCDNKHLVGIRYMQCATEHIIITSDLVMKIEIFFRF